MTLQPNFNIICRICLIENSELKSLYVLENIEGQTTTLANLLMSFASIQAIGGDGLPENICLNCVQALNKVVSFRNLCERSDATLRLWLAAFLPDQNEIKQKDEKFLYDDFRAKNEDVINGNGFSHTEDASSKQNEDGFFNEQSRFDSVDTDVNVFNADAPKKYISDSEDESALKNFLHVSESKVRKSHSCSKCNENFPSLAEYKKHMVDQHKKSYSCEICGKTFKIEIFLKRHLAVHKQNSGPVTKKRKKAFERKQTLPRTCTICNKTFRFHSNLERHKLIHTGEKPYLCNVCGKSFSQLSYLKIHSFIHTGEKPYKCQMCDRSFGAPGTLMTHIRTHTGERPHICKICGKDFPQSGYLSAHIRIHTGEKPAECKVCHRRFNQSGRLTVHMRMHSGEKPYSCRECGRCFAVKGTLKKHLRTHTGERPYVCSVCGQAFGQSGTLSTHMKVHKPKLVV